VLSSNEFGKELEAASGFEPLHRSFAVQKMTKVSESE